MFIRTTGLIPRPTLPARRQLLNKESGSIFENSVETITYENFDCLKCTVQPTQGRELQQLPEGMRNKEAYTIRSETILTSAIEGSNRLGDQIQYTAVDGATHWFTIIKVKKWAVGVIPHCESIMVREPEPLVTELVEP